MAEAPWRRLALLVVALGGAGCGAPDPWDQPLRFVVLPLPGETATSAELLAGVAWIPSGQGTSLPLTDVRPVPGVSTDFGWAPVGPAPAGAVRTCDRIGCIEGETAAVGWLVAFVDADGDGGAVVQLPEGPLWSPRDLVADGEDRLVAIATDHVLAYAAADLDPAGGLAQTLGWPLPAGAAVMGTRHEDGQDLLSPTVTRERVPLYVLAVAAGQQEAGLCCDAPDCAGMPVHCPSFQGQ